MVPAERSSMKVYMFICIYEHVQQYLGYVRISIHAFVLLRFFVFGPSLKSNSQLNWHESTAFWTSRVLAGGVLCPQSSFPSNQQSITYFEVYKNAGTTIYLCVLLLTVRTSTRRTTHNPVHINMYAFILERSAGSILIPAHSGP